MQAAGSPLAGQASKSAPNYSRLCLFCQLPEWFSPGTDWQRRWTKLHRTPKFEKTSEFYLSPSSPLRNGPSTDSGGASEQAQLLPPLRSEELWERECLLPFLEVVYVPHQLTCQALCSKDVLAGNTFKRRFKARTLFVVPTRSSHRHRQCLTFVGLTEALFLAKPFRATTERPESKPKIHLSTTMSPIGDMGNGSHLNGGSAQELANQ